MSTIMPKSYNPSTDAIEENKRLSSPGHKTDTENEEAKALRNQIRELENSLGTALDQNDELRHEVHLLQSTINQAEIMIEESEGKIQKLTQIIEKCQCIQRKKEQRAEKKFVETRSL